jgi:hypothetical protein
LIAKRLIPPMLFICAVASALFPAASPAARWSSLQLPGEASDVALYSVSCPTASLCVAVGANNTIASSTEPTGGPSKWRVSYAGQGSDPEAANYRQVRSVSCPSPQLCVAVTFEGMIYTSTDPTGGSSAWNVTDLDPGGPNTHLYGVSCPTVKFCAASAGGAQILTSTDPTGGPSAWTKTQLEGPLELRGISCASASFCLAVGDNGDNIRPEPTDEGRIYSSTNPLSGNWQQAQAPVRGSAYGVSCPTAGFCLSGDRFGNLLVSSAPASPASWRSFGSGGTVQITDVDCASSALCAAVDNNGDVMTSTSPSGGTGAWTFTNLVPFQPPDGTPNAMFGVSCPSVSLCAIAAKGGQIFTSTDPFGAPADTPTATTDPQHGKKHRPRPKRPRVMITGHREPEMELSQRRVTIPFRFYALNHAQVRRFLCRIDHRPLRPCHSPKLYRVGFGKQVFRVRAVGWTGLKGPIAIATFWTCRKDDRPGCGHGKWVIAPDAKLAVDGALVDPPGGQSAGAPRAGDRRGSSCPPRPSARGCGCRVGDVLSQRGSYAHPCALCPSPSGAHQIDRTATTSSTESSSAGDSRDPLTDKRQLAAVGSTFRRPR